ncbi:glutamate transport system permease protein [Nocardioides sp. BE266]|uniref:amino acid ABC transporter permease n=1 Tax=Nocardioides sp. BE266 TaxID=2817725 RepID=UPI0028662171|nr:amino acid ABC transporter permease [Nocardioides sp. BE266]MDR7252225.1 glutamate transport system permease protein [Nocardioides sp. BE266]
MDAVLESLPDVFKAFGYTVLLFLVAGVFSLIGGTVLVALRVGPIGVLSKAAATYVTLVRNTPLLAVFFFFSFAAPRIGINFKWVDVHIGTFDFTSFFSTAVVALTLYTSTFVCEALRSGVNAVPLGQAEAARAIGLPFGGVMSQVVLPQAFRAAVPPVASALIALLKNTSVAAVFGVIEAASQMKIMTNNNADERWGIFIAFALGYVVLVEIVSLAAGTLERRWRIA